MKTAYIVAIVLTAAIIIAVVVKAVVVHVLRKKGREEVLKTCSIADGNTIFVSLVAVKDATGAGATLHSLFKEARCPLRVHVGLCEIYNDDGDHADQISAVDVYKDLCSNSTSPFCLTDNIRVLRVPASEAHGAFAAREHIERYLYRSETYVATFACPAAVSKHWDEYCVETFTKLECQTAVLTTQLGPQESGNAWACSVSQPGSYIGVTGTGPVVVNDQHINVPRFGGFRMKHVPTYRDGSDRQAVHTLPSIAWSSSFSFSLGIRIDDVPFPRNGTWPADPLEDVIMTCRLLAAKWKLFCPTGCVGQTQAGGLPDTAGGPLPLQLHPDLARAACITPEGMKALGVVNGRVSARARLGLSRAPDEHELRGKIGSTTEYLSLLARIDLNPRKLET